MQIKSEERLQRAISSNLPPDRVPVAPLIYFFAGTNAGLTPAELISNPVKYRAAMEKCWEDFGPWDAYIPINAISRQMMSLAMPMKNVYPGEEIPESSSIQFLEEEIMFPDDYKILLEPLFPVSKRKFRYAFFEEVEHLLSMNRRKGRSIELKGEMSLKNLFINTFGERRDFVKEIHGWIIFLRELLRLLMDKSVDLDRSLRYSKFLLYLSRQITGESSLPDFILRSLVAVYEQIDFTRNDFDDWRERGVTPLYGMGLEGPFDTFSMARSMIPFTADDLFNLADVIREACDVAVNFFIAVAEIGTALTGVPRFICACHRTSNDFISPTHFKELVLPSIKKITEELARRGITTIFHCDGKWDFNLKYLTDLPEGKCVFEFDGRTDMLLARKVLGDNHCIFGDVPAAMLAFGNKEEVKTYCKKLIREIGHNGRFILSSGCEIPPNAKPENVRALLRAPFLGTRM